MEKNTLSEQFKHIWQAKLTIPHCRNSSITQQAKKSIPLTLKYITVHFPDVIKELPKPPLTMKW